MFQKVLIANRGEIAVRVIRACKEMGIKTVAVYSEADADALHVALADESYCIGGPLVKDSYLNINAILTVAKRSGVQGIHPGYGLLSENADFARKCSENGIVFIGPAPEVIEKMGDKDEARRTMKEALVPIIEGSDIITSVEEGKEVATRVGYPILIKARSGGGGRGIRPVYSEEEFEENFYSAGEEAKAAFGDGALYIEKFLTDVKHVEVQILADKYGKVVVLGDRDCSMQRKNQKLIEECPAPALSKEVRKKMYEAARSATSAVDYVTVGTIEFLLDKEQNFYFMEMNTRLQVEHSVTEMVCGIDIVKWQIRTAAGMAISFSEESIHTLGRAIECRICAEDPVTFTPSCGKIDLLHIPGGHNVRFDSALYQNYTVSPYYDSMLGKVIVAGKSREEAIRKMRTVLSELIINGVNHNSEMHLSLISEPEFEDASYTTSFMKGRLV